jgi:hypothetical protein
VKRITIPARVICYVEDDDAMVRARKVRSGVYELADDDAAAVFAHLEWWRDALATESKPTGDMRADRQALARVHLDGG